MSKIEKNKRVFWLGMHVVLTKTELPRLRNLGFEVFNPPYNANVYDQSANLDWESEQLTTLPPKVFKELSEYNFFYNSISSRVAKILNEYFGTIIVTINPDWLEQILKVYHGRIIYRVYGQPYSLSESLWQRRCFQLIQEKDFWFVPHAQETVVDEHDWLKRRMAVVPYILPMDVFEYRDTWGEQNEHKKEIMVSCPNINNPYYAAKYQYLNDNYQQPYMRIYGIQRDHIDDNRVVGTLKRQQLLEAYQKSSGYFYFYQEQNVCYLPPIEMMVIGGPVLYLPDSLLARYFQEKSPGLCQDKYEVAQKSKWLLGGDQSFINEVIESQKPVREKYSPEFVNPIFDSTFKQIISSAPDPSFVEDKIILSTSKTSESQQANSEAKNIYVLHHFPGGILRFKEGKYLSSEGIPRVFRKLVEALVTETDNQIFITCTSQQVQETYGFFYLNKYQGRIKLIVVDENKVNYSLRSDILKKWVKKNLQFVKDFRDHFKSLRGFDSYQITESAMLWADKNKQFINLLVKNKFFLNSSKKLQLLIEFLTLTIYVFSPFIFIVIWLFKIPAQLLKFVISLFGSVRIKILSLRGRIERLKRKLIYSLGKLEYVNYINRDENAICTVIPHYYLFPEAFLIRKETMMYLPDYTPHFFKIAFDGKKDAINVLIGKTLAKKAKKIFTNSWFTKSYLSETKLEVEKEKIEVIPIPLLSPKNKLEKINIDTQLQWKIKNKIKNKKYIFYPTQNRPNKQINFLFKIFSEIKSEIPDVHLVLTCSLGDYAPAETAYLELDDDCKKSVLFMSGVSDEMLRYLYRNAMALCLTSTMEGNFPPQIFEALSNNTPVVATKLPLITEVLDGEAINKLCLCEPFDLFDFVEKLLYVFDNREEICKRQSFAYHKLLEKCNDEEFNKSVINLINLF